MQLAFVSYPHNFTGDFTIRGPTATKFIKLREFHSAAARQPEWDFHFQLALANAVHCRHNREVPCEGAFGGFM